MKKLTLSHSLIFLFSGHAGVGKSFCANIASGVVSKLRLMTGTFPFAKGVKDTARFMGWDGAKDAKGRRLLQGVGNFGREYDKDIWVKSTIERIEADDRYPFDVVMVDDWRYKNELFYIKENCPLYIPIPIKVIAPDRELLVGTPEYNDDSETELDDFNPDYFLLNAKEYTNIAYRTEELVLDIINKYTLAPKPGLEWFNDMF